MHASILKNKQDDPTAPLIGSSMDRNVSRYQSNDDDGDGVSNMAHRRREALRITSLIYATLASLCNGSIVVFSLYAPIFQSHLHYSTLQINGIAIAGSLALYLPMSIMVSICDHSGSAVLALISSSLYGTGYQIAAWTYSRQEDLGSEQNNRVLYIFMLLAFVCIGTGTCALYIASVTTSAKNFVHSKHKGLVIAMPVTAFGLSGALISQAGSSLFAIIAPDGGSEIDAFALFNCLSILLCMIGLVGVFALQVVDEHDDVGTDADRESEPGLRQGYNAISSEPVEDGINSNNLQKRASKMPFSSYAVYAFLTDATVWPFALAFFFIVGPTEAFLNNLGSILRSLSPPNELIHSAAPETHIAIFSLGSTFTRLSLGIVTDLLAPAKLTEVPRTNQMFSVSRVTFLVTFGLVQSFALFFLASGTVQNHVDRFWIVSGLMGLGCGASYTLSPLIIANVWGVDSFGTNFGIINMLPALGSAFWGLVYSAVYESNSKPTSPVGSGDEVFCYGRQCYAATYWVEGCIMWAACALLIWVWKGKGGWLERGIVL